MVNDVDTLIKVFFKNGGKSFRQGMNYLISLGYDKNKSEDIVKKYFISSKPKDTTPEKFVGKGIDIEIPLKMKETETYNYDYDVEMLWELPPIGGFHD